MYFGPFFWIGFAIAVGIWASNRGRSGFGWFLLSCVISPLLAAIFLAVTKNHAEPKLSSVKPNELTHAKCSQCAEFVLPEAHKCKHCGAVLNPDPLFQQKAEALQRSNEKEDSNNLLIGIGFVVFLIVIAKLFS